ncbi:MAG: DNA repair protein RadC [Eubacterium sp.]|nr:DNA repair protein RadC [Candidatus Colimonas fimequi]
MRIKELPSEERPREKMLRNGKQSLSSAELIALIIGSGPRGCSAMEVALRILAKDDRGLGYLAECTPEELMNIDGVGAAKASQLLAAVELGRRIAAAPAVSRNVITCAQDVTKLYMDTMRYYKKEYFICVLLNAKGEIIQSVTISVGDLSSSLTHPREVFVEAVRRSASSVVFIHNHPSGDPQPSSDDIVTTQRLIKVGELLCIPVVDHIIIGDGRYVSLKESGYVT